MKYAFFSKRDPRICPCVKETFTSPQQQNCYTLKEGNTCKGLGELPRNKQNADSARIEEHMNE